MESAASPSFLNLFFFLLLNSFPHHISSSPFPNGSLPTMSGYLPVNPATASAIFYTFYEAQSPTFPLPRTPLLIWLQGGPGCSSMLGNFFELGPWRLKHLKLEPNSGSWNRIFGLLFLDNPIGTGFSIASTPGEIPRDQNSVAKHLFTAIVNFIDIDPSFKNRPIYITGESYAGKYVPSIGYYILNKNAKLTASRRVNLMGVAIGNGLTDPVIQAGTHAANFYFLGLINERQKTELEIAQREVIKLIKEKNWRNATNSRINLLNSLENMTSLATFYDYSRKSPYQTYLVTNFLSNKEAKKALGVNETMVYEECSDTVGAALSEDVMKSVKYKVEVLVKKSRVLLYQGFFDLRDGPVSTAEWVKTMKWEGIGRFMGAARKVWEVEGKLAGYVQKWRSLSNVVVLGAGHLVPADQALNSQAMIEDWVLEKGLFAKEQDERIES